MNNAKETLLQAARDNDLVNCKFKCNAFLKKTRS